MGSRSRKIKEPPGPGEVEGGDVRAGVAAKLLAAALGSAQPVLAGAPGPEAPSYVNIPASPSSRKQLHYLGLELQEAAAGVRGASPHGWAGIGA